MIAVVMGCDKVRKRAQEAQTLLEYGFKNFATIEAVKKDIPFGPIKVRRGKQNQISLIPAEIGKVTVAKGKENSISVKPELPPYLVAPIQKGQVFGKVLIQNEGKVIKEINLLSSSQVEKRLLPPWVLIIGGILGMTLIVLIGFWWFRQRKRKAF
jgi:D-alanyl-D-alanine carboxypeptidase (penicillin-binding protein 5/6)